MLRRDNDRHSLNRPTIFIPNRNLALGVRSQSGLTSTVPRFGEKFQNTVTVLNRGRHQFRCLVRRVAEHYTLIARSLFLVSGRIDPLSDMLGLPMQKNVDINRLPVKPVLSIADIPDRHAGAVGDKVSRHLIRAPILPRDDDPVGRRKRFSCASKAPNVQSLRKRRSIIKVDDLV